MKDFKYRLERIDTRIVLVIISLLAVVWLQVPRLGDEFRVDEDFRSFYWMYKFQEPSLFPDYSQGYTLVRLPWADVPVTFKSLGYGLLFYGASFFITPILFSKLLPFLLAPVTVLYLFAFGQSLHNRMAGIILAMGFLFFNLASSSAISMANGLQRSFAMTLIVMLIFYVYHQKYMATLIVMLLSALIYPPAFVFGGIIWCANVLKANWPLRKMPLTEAGLGYLIMSFCIGVLILSPVVFAQTTGIFGSEQPKNVNQEQTMATLETAWYFWDRPEYRKGGAAPLFIIFPVVGRGGLVDLGEDLVNLCIFAVIGGLIYLVRGRKALDLPDVVWETLWGSLILFTLSWLVIWLVGSPLLYWPSRYTRVGLFMFGSMFVLLNMASFVKEVTSLIRQKPQKLLWLIVGIEILVVSLVIWYPSEWTMIRGFNMKWLLLLTGLLCGILGSAVIRKPGHSLPNISEKKQSFAVRVLIGLGAVLFLLGWAIYTPIFTEVSYLNPNQAERALFQFLETLPEDIWLAGTPCALDSVPLFAKRQALFSCEYNKTVPVILGALRAYYSDDPQVITNFCRNHNIDYLVVDLNTYSPQYLDEGQLFFEPYNQQLLEEITGQESFFLADVPEEIKIFQTDNVYVISCDALNRISD
ncbi:MAG: hypothetical protein JXM69_21160 [Anaerolineae bacterium]|nr:hypothetical protein [Anaerolineae bacterium]